MTVFLIRHGQTDANGKCYSGRADIPLNQAGHAQAQVVAQTLLKNQIDRILASPLRRAQDTAIPLATAKGLKIETVPALSELDFGQLEGKPKRDEKLALRKTNLYVPLDGGEALADLWKRLAPVSEFLVAQDLAGQNIAVFAHFWSIRLLVGRLRSISLENAVRSRDSRLGNGAAMDINCRYAQSI